MYVLCQSKHKFYSVYDLYLNCVKLCKRTSNLSIAEFKMAHTFFLEENDTYMHPIYRVYEFLKKSGHNYNSHTYIHPVYKDMIKCKRMSCKKSAGFKTHIFIF